MALTTLPANSTLRIVYADTGVTIAAFDYIPSDTIDVSQKEADITQVNPIYGTPYFKLGKPDLWAINTGSVELEGEQSQFDLIDNLITPSNWVKVKIMIGAQVLVTCVLNSVSTKRNVIKGSGWRVGTIGFITM